MATTLQSMALYFFNSMKNQWTELIEENVDYLVYYLVITALLSFAATHYFLRSEGNPYGVNVSSGLKDIVAFLVRLLGIVSLYHSTSSVFHSMVLISFIVGYKFLSSLLAWTSVSELNDSTGRSLLGTVISAAQHLFMFGTEPRRLSKKHLYRDKFLTEEEYELQTKMTTDKSLEDLFESDDFKEWAMKNKDRISVSPRRLTRQ